MCYNMKISWQPEDYDTFMSAVIDDKVSNLI